MCNRGIDLGIGGGDCLLVLQITLVANQYAFSRLSPTGLSLLEAFRQGRKTICVGRVVTEKETCAY